MGSFGKRVPGFMLALALLAVPAGDAFALNVAELMEFLEAEVPDDLILRLLESSGPPEDLAPGDVVALWEAGASDRLIEALLPPAEKPQQPASATRLETDTIRAYYRDEPDGGKVFVLTNLDDEGRRLDGSPTSGSRPNLVTSRPWEPLPEPSEAAAPPAEMNPAPQAPSPPQEVYYPSHGPSTFVQTSPYLGFFYRQPFSHLYPPGSYTHFKLYHQGGNKPGLGHYQMPLGQVFYNPPFPTAGSHRGNQRIRWR